MRELTRPVARRIGELVVTVEDRGLRVRYRRRRKAVLIPWQQIVELACDRAAGRVPSGRLFESIDDSLTNSNALTQFTLRHLKNLET